MSWIYFCDDFDFNCNIIVVWNSFQKSNFISSRGFIHLIFNICYLQFQNKTVKKSYYLYSNFLHTLFVQGGSKVTKELQYFIVFCCCLLFEIFIKKALEFYHGNVFYWTADANSETLLLISVIHNFNLLSKWINN